MDQDKAVKMLMRAIKDDDVIPNKYLGFVRRYLHLMYVMGYDEGNIYKKNPRQTSVKGIDQYGNERVFESIKEAAHYCKCNPITISKALMHNGNGRAVGYIWSKEVNEI